jgi:hypothetical protein
MAMTHKEAARIISRRMDGAMVPVDRLMEACRVYRMRPETLERCRKAADAVTGNAHEPVLVFGRDAAMIHGLEPADRDHLDPPEGYLDVS